MLERNGIYQARIRTEAGRYLWRSLRTRNQSQAIFAARRLFHSIEFRQQSGLPVARRSVNRVIDEYVALRERQQSQGRTSAHMLRQIKRVLSFNSGNRIKLREVYLLSAQRFARHRRRDIERCGVRGMMRP
jgi:hypothetical protein